VDSENGVLVLIGSRNAVLCTKWAGETLRFNAMWAAGMYCFITKRAKGRQYFSINQYSKKKRISYVTLSQKIIVTGPADHLRSFDLDLQETKTKCITDAERNTV
jgi:hypothetical protein